MDSTTAGRLDQGDRVLIADQYTEAAGGGSGDLRAAKKIVKTGALRVPGEPVGVHAATVIHVGDSAVPGRLDVVTNLGTVHAVIPGQRFRLAPAGPAHTANAVTAPHTEAERLLAGGGDSYGVRPMPAVDLTALLAAAVTAPDPSDPWAAVFAGPAQ